MHPVAVHSDVSPQGHAWYRLLGLLPLCVLGGAVVAALVHHWSALPGDYSWGFPLRIMRMVVRSGHFPTLLLAAFVIGRFALRGTWKLDGTFAVLRARQRIGSALLAALALLTLGLLFSEYYTLLDGLALLVMGGVLGFQRPPRAQVVAFIAHLAGTVLLFSLVSYTFTVFKALLFTSNVPMDASLVAFEQWLLGTNPHRAIAAWLSARPGWAWWADRVYFSLFDHMILVSALLVGMQQARERTEYLAALTLCYVLGGLTYFLLPGIGPMYAEPANFAFLKGSGLETARVGATLYANTRAVVQGTAQSLQTYSYIACMPSLHMAHELIMLYYARRSRLAFALSLVFTLATFLSVLGLGWHYAIDAVGSVILSGLVVALVRWQGASLLPLAAGRLVDVPLPRPQRRR